jgi:hypothetical protein
MVSTERPVAPTPGRHPIAILATIVVLVAVAVLAACSSDGDRTGDTIASAEVDQTTQDSQSQPTGTPPPADTPSDGPSITPAPDTPPPPAPADGQALVIVAVADDDVLNFRVEPDPSADIVDTARPDIAQYPRTTEILATGLARSVGSSTWWQVTVDGQEVWANARYLGVLGPVDDATADLVDLEATGDATLEDVVAEARPYPGAWGTMVFLEGVDAISSYATIDVLGPVGPGIKGERFLIEAGNLIDYSDEDAQFLGYRIWTAQRTLICEVGLDSSGGCA